MRPFLIILPILGYCLLTIIFAKKVSLKEFFESFTKAHLSIFFFIAVTTELWSSLSMISFSGIIMGWILFLTSCLSIAAIRTSRKYFNGFVLARYSTLSVIFVCVVSFFALTTLLTALLYPPNNYDSMTYHLPRVVHWINNRSVSFYPTTIPRQLYSAPLSEYAILQLQLITGSDFFANLIQWMSFFSLLCISYIVAAELGLSKRQQQISTIVIATLPMAILQASSTQNDLVVSSFVMSFGFFMLRLRNDQSIRNWVFVAIALGLAILTKGTAYLYCCGVGIFLAIPILWEHRHRHAQFISIMAKLILVIIFALVLNGIHYMRNFNLYNHPLSTETNVLKNDDMSVALLTSNIIRNSSIHLSTPYDTINEYILSALIRTLGSQLNNPQTTLRYTRFAYPNKSKRHEDFSGNLIHMVIILFGFIILPILWINGRYTRTICYSMGVLCGAILYCYLLKWQPWASRLHTPLFALASPLIAIIVTSGIGIIGKLMSGVIILGLVGYSLSFALSNSTRPLFPVNWYHQSRNELYFPQGMKTLYPFYKAAVDILIKERANEVGLYCGVDSPEYYLWVLATSNNSDGGKIVFRHVDVNNISKSIHKNLPLPSYVVWIHDTKDWINAKRYTPLYGSKYLSVMKKQE